MNEKRINKLNDFIKKNQKSKVSISKYNKYKDEITMLLNNDISVNMVLTYLKENYIGIKFDYCGLTKYIQRWIRNISEEKEIVVLAEVAKKPNNKSSKQIDTAKPLSNQEKYKFEDDLKEKKILTYNEILKINKIFGFIDFKKHFQKFIFTPNLNLLDTNEFRLTNNMSQEQQGELVKSRIKEEIAIQISEIAQRDIYLKQKDEILLLMKENINNNIPTSFSLTDFPPNLTTNPFKINNNMTAFEKDIVRDLELEYKLSL